MNRTRILLGLLLTALSAGALLWSAPLAGATTGPQNFVYNGHLLDSSGNALTTSHTIRFSLWTSTDYASTDVTSTGALHIAASTYASWNQESTVTPNSNGYFTVSLGSGSSLPDFASYSTADLQSLHLQVEVKTAGADDTAYELLDVNGDIPTIDRSPMLTVPFALNADMVDQYHVGSSSGSIPILGSGGNLLAGGTNADTFTIDGDASTSGDIKLQFGHRIQKELSYDQSNTWFNFNDDVRIQGDLTVTGIINGIDFDNLATTTEVHLKVSSGAGLNINIASGGYQLAGAVTNYPGDSDVSISNNTTNYVFFGSGGLSVSTIGFPTDESNIQLAEVVTSGGEISSVTDRRVLSTDNREQDVEKFLHAEFQNASYQGDATDNVGQMVIDHDNSNLRNFYQWSSTRTSLQDYDVILRTSLSSDFVRWQGNHPLSVTYRSTSASTDDNKLDISVFDTNGSPVSLSGSTTSLANTSWTTTNIEFTGSPTWTAGQDLLIKFKMYAKDDYQMHLGDLKLHYVDLKSN